MNTPKVERSCAICGHAERYHDAGGGPAVPACYAAQDGQGWCDVYHSFRPLKKGAGAELPEHCPKCVEMGRPPSEKWPYVPHDPSPWCQSGKRPHCTCDTCY